MEKNFNKKVVLIELGFDILNESTTNNTLSIVF